MIEKAKKTQSSAIGLIPFCALSETKGMVIKMKNKKYKINIFLIVLGIIIIFYSAVIAFISNLNITILIPAVLGLPLLFYGLYKEKYSRFFIKGFGKFLLYFTKALYGIFILALIICTSLIISTASQTPKTGADVIIVLGAGIRGEVISNVLKSRLDKAFELYSLNKNASIIVSGGKGFGESITEALAMERYLIKLGVSKDKIIKEETSTNTKENFSFSKIIIDNKFKNSTKNIIFVTNDFHVFRAGNTAKVAGINAIGIGCSTDWYLVPSYYLRETISIIRNVIFGWE